MKKINLILTTVSLPLDFVMLALAGLSAYFLRFNSFFVKLKPVIFNLPFEKYLPLMLGVAGGWLLLFIFSGLYSGDTNRRLTSELSRVFFSCSTGLAAVTIFIFFRGELFNSRFIVLAGWVLAIVFVGFGKIFLRLIKNAFYRFNIGVRRLVIIGEGHVADVLRQFLFARKGFGYAVVGQFAHFDDKIAKELTCAVKKGQLDQILLTDPKADAAEALAIIDFCEMYHLDFKYSADLFSTYVSNMSVVTIGGIPIVEWHKTRLQAWGRVIKRVLDIVLSILFLFVSVPFQFLTALIILLETGWPIFYKNERIGENDKHFFVWKFRSMHQKFCTGVQFGNNTSAMKKEQELISAQNSKNGPVYKIKDDPRITCFGRFIRRWSLDELPQLFNVLKGEMSLVGPRPHQPREVAQYQKHHRKVLNIKPGLTGLAQISGRSDLEFEEEVRLDTFYLEHWSVFLDLIIILKTPFILLKHRRAL